MCDVSATYLWRLHDEFAGTTMTKRIAAPLRILSNVASMRRNSCVSFRCCGVAVAFEAIPGTPYVRKPIRKCVRAAYIFKLVSHSDASNWRLFRNYYETYICDRNTTLQPLSHCSHTEWVIKT